MDTFKMVQQIANRAFMVGNTLDHAHRNYCHTIRHFTERGSDGLTRRERAEAILAQGAVKFVVDTTFLVGGCGTDYVVTVNDGGTYNCNCPDFAMCGLPCKHVLAAAVVKATRAEQAEGGWLRLSS